jgi:hypothetical protein
MNGGEAVVDQNRAAGKRGDERELDPSGEGVAHGPGAARSRHAPRGLLERESFGKAESVERSTGEPQSGQPRTRHDAGLSPEEPRVMGFHHAQELQWGFHPRDGRPLLIDVVATLDIHAP